MKQNVTDSWINLLWLTDYLKKKNTIHINLVQLICIKVHSAVSTVDNFTN